MSSRSFARWRRPYSYDVTPDGQRILALVPTAAERPPLTVIVNWQPESSANTN
jgi:hypothetical protein